MKSIHPFKLFIGEYWLVVTCAVIVTLSAIGYAPIFQKQFLQEDFVQVGIRHFDANAAAQSGEWLPLAWKWGFRAPVTQRAVIRVVRDWTLWLDYFAWHLQPLGYHLTNLLLHVLTSFAVTLLAWRLCKTKLTAALAGIFFAVLSIHPEAVADIPSRGHQLAALLMTLTLIFYTRLPARAARVGGYVSFALALLSVETALILPLLLVVYDLIYHRADGFKPLAKRQAPFWALLGAYAGWRVILFGGGGGRRRSMRRRVFYSSGRAIRSMRRTRFSPILCCGKRSASTRCICFCSALIANGGTYCLGCCGCPFRCSSRSRFRRRNVIFMRRPSGLRLRSRAF